MKKDVKTETVEQKENEQTMTETEKALIEENEKLIAEIESLQAEKDKLSATCKRLQSSADKSDTYLNQLVAMKNDFESYKRRMKFNGEQAKKDGVQQVLVKLIAVVDTFEIAAKHLEGDNLKAFTMIQNQFEQVLIEFGAVKMDVMGQPFDPLKMNALSKMDYGEDKRDLVVEVYKQGYETEDKVLRFAEVIVGS